jgi:hypothetical protein
VLCAYAAPLCCRPLRLLRGVMERWRWLCAGAAGAEGSAGASDAGDAEAAGDPAPWSWGSCGCPSRSRSKRCGRSALAGRIQAAVVGWPLRSCSAALPHSKAARLDHLPGFPGRPAALAMPRVGQVVTLHRVRWMGVTEVCSSSVDRTRSRRPGGMTSQSHPRARRGVLEVREWCEWSGRAVRASLCSLCRQNTS